MVCLLTNLGQSRAKIKEHSRLAGDEISDTCTEKANVGNAKRSALGASGGDVHVYGLSLMTLLEGFSANQRENLGDEKPFHTSPPVTE